MKFDFNSKPAHPRKIMTIINKFVNDLGVTREGKYKVYFTVRRDEDNCAYDCADFTNLTCDVGICFSNLMLLDTFFIRQFAIEKCPCLKGFSYLTFILLHEIGHHAEAKKYDPETEYTADEWMDITFHCIDISKTQEECEMHLQKYYSETYNERLATDWAIDWISNAENRKKAKAFEKEFFKTWRG